MNFTPLYVMDRIMVGIFFMCSVDFFRNENIQVTNCEWMHPLYPTPETPRPVQESGDLGPGGGKQRWKKQGPEENPATTSPVKTQ